MKIYEKFIGFVQVDSNTGFELSETIFSTLRSLNSDIKKLRGQGGYDGAANMSGPIKGVQSRILAVQPLAFYTHCQGHNLNLVVTDSCEVADVRNTIGTVKQVINFFRASAQRNSVFQSKLSTDASYKRLHSLCETSWSERATGLKCFIESLIPIFEGLATLNSTDFNKDTSSQARTLLVSISHFDFIITLIVTSKILSEINTLSRSLQAIEIDLNQAFDYVDNVILRFKQYRNDADLYFSELYIEALEISEQFNIEVKIPRLCGKQTKRTNIPSESTEIYS